MQAPRIALLALAMLAPVLLSACNDSTAPRDRTAPAAPRNVHSITGDHQVVLAWLDNTEADVAGYNVYVSPCASGGSCPYDRVGTTSGTQFVVRDLTNGVTRYFAVSAVDEAGNESALSYEAVLDTPRPEGSELVLDNYLEQPATSGYDFSAFAVKRFDSNETDVYFGANAGVLLMLAPFEDTQIQDAGYTGSLDDVDYSPAAGWSPSGTVELVVGHSYVVRAPGDHYAKLRVTSLTTHWVELEWAYQLDAGNRELGARRAKPVAPRVRRPLPWDPVSPAS